MSDNVHCILCGRKVKDLEEHAFCFEMLRIGVDNYNDAM